MRIANPFLGAASVARELRLNGCFENHWQLRWKPICSSTEKELTNWLYERPLNRNLSRAFIASRQSHGVGQRGRNWISPYGGVWLSAVFAMQPYKDKVAPGLMGLSIAVAFCEMLERKNVPIEIKWPNDLIVQNKKLGGILPRILHRGKSLRMGRIGLGLNVINHVPLEGISVSQVLNINSFHADKWLAESLFSIERGLQIMENSEFVRNEAHRRLFNKFVRDTETGEFWDIEGIDLNGGLNIKKGSKRKVWTRWE